MGDGLNLYAYCFNNPNSFIDPLGLCAVKNGWNSLMSFFGQFALSPLADLWDDYAAQSRLILEDMVYGNGDLWWMAASLQTCMDVGGGFVDLLRFGEGFAEGGWGYAQDALSGLGIASMAYAGLTKAVAAARNSQFLRNLVENEIGAIGTDLSKTQWGWRNSKPWREALKEIDRGGTIEKITGKIPTREEAIDLIKSGGGKIQRIEAGHATPNPHNYPHINYATSTGTKGTVKIQGL